ncbi:hypothetical protein AB0J74_08950 [Asanoa sp. NPDC049573]|uniref:hypothetical protein n=1 Tax=Asanoa sp. NPDC049573 TaxID=3155396 RepID=UPI00341BA81A
MQPSIKDRRSPTVAAGEEKGAWRAILEQGAHLLRSSAPMSGFDVYRNTAMNIDVARTRADRQSLLPLARPQWGVDDMKDDFTGTSEVPGVFDVRAANG